MKPVQRDSTIMIAGTSAGAKWLSTNLLVAFSGCGAVLAWQRVRLARSGA
jgi:hypothetical protein